MSFQTSAKPGPTKYRQISKSNGRYMLHEVEPLLFSIADAAKSLGVSHWTVRHLLRTRKLARVRIGNRVLVSCAELNRFIADSTESAINTTNSDEASDDLTLGAKQKYW